MSILQFAKTVCLGTLALGAVLLPFILSANFYGTDTTEWAFVGFAMYFVLAVVVFLWVLGAAVQEAWRLR